MQLLSRQEAIKAGHTKYQGRRCLRGHSGVRYVANKACVDCKTYYDKAWKMLHTERELIRRRDWKKKHHAVVSAQKNARRRRLPGDATNADVRLLWELQGGACAYCGATGDLHLDHKYPRSLGGRHTFGNLQWLCARHNMHKKAIPDEEYRAAHGIPKITPWDSLL